MLNNDPDTAARATPDTGSAPSSAVEDRGSRWRLRNWRLRSKMAAVLLVPTVAALGVGGVRVYDGLATTSQLSSLVDQVELAQRSADLSHELQRERDYAVVRAASGDPAATEQYNNQAGRVDQATRELRAVESDVADFPPEVRDSYEAATNRVDSLDSLRGTVQDGFTVPQTLNAYNGVLDNMLNISRSVAVTATDTDVNEVARAAEALGRAKEQLSQQRSLLLGASIRGSYQAGETDDIRAAKAQYEAALNEFQTSASAQQLTQYDAVVAGDAVDRTEQLEQNALISADGGDSPGIDAGEWQQQSAARTDLVHEVEQQALTDFHDQAEDLTSSVRWAAVRDALAVLLLLAVAFGVAAYIARSMLQPLRTLRYGALEIAQERLPEAITRVNASPQNSGHVSVPPVPVQSYEEIGQVARSFDAVHQQALRLASEQAMLRSNINDLFVNLARRSQTLVQQQLSLIERLEQDEQDPDQLASLFELDHMATRMRRNNENLLILGGTELTRRMVRPVPLNEVLGAAVSEVEQYARVAVTDAPDLALQGRMVNDFVHLAAELFENATVFSSPESEVTVRSSYRRQELVVEIRDRGVGVDPEDLEDINERLLYPPEIDVAVSRRMGLHVVGHLAMRNNIRVQLANNDDLEGGAMATIHVSGEYISQLTPDGPKPMPDMPRPEQRDSLTETGSHMGLAAAFGRAGGQHSSSAAETPAPETPAPETPAPETSAASGTSSIDPSVGEPPALPPLSLDPTPDPPGSDSSVEPLDMDASSAAEQDSADSTAGPDAPAYSVRMTESSAYEASDVPAWDGDTGWPAETSAATTSSAVEPAQSPMWPSEDIPEGIGGTCGVPMDASSELFRNPFEEGTTTQFTRISDADEPGNADTSNAASGQRDGEAGALPIRRPDSDSRLAEPASTAESASAAAGSRQSAPAGPPVEDDAPTQRLPIYEAVLSQWFRESDVDEPMLSAAQGGTSSVAQDDTRFGEPSTADAASAAGTTTGPAALEEIGAYPSQPVAPASPGDPVAPVAGDGPAADRDPLFGSGVHDAAPNGAPVDDTAAHEPIAHDPVPHGPALNGSTPDDTGQVADPAPLPAEDGARDTVSEGVSWQAEAVSADTAANPAASEADPGWGSADAGWRAAEALLDGQQQEETAAGLPKRVPKSNLVPGSADSRSQSGSRPAAKTSRSAEAVRGRMADFQQGIRRGRHSRADATSDEPSSRHEEQE